MVSSPSGTATRPSAPPSDALRVIRVPLDSLQPDPGNVRTHDQVNLDAIRGSLSRFGQAEPLVVQTGTRRVIAGHGRLEAMRALGWTECDVVELPIEDVDAVALGLALNRTSELASWHEEGLAKLLDQLRAEDALDGIGYSDGDIDALLDDLQRSTGETTPDVDEVPEPPDIPVTRRGDLWVMGGHRLLCADAAAPDDVDRLLAGAPVHLVNTDPPYNVRVEPRSKNAIAAGHSSFASTETSATTTPGKMRARDRPLTNDFVSDEAFGELLRAWFGNMARVLQPGRAFYIWGGYSNCGNYPPVLAECGLYFSQALIWDKQHPVITRKDYMGAHEWSFYGWREGAAHEFFGPNNATDLWSVKKVNPQAMEHLTEKPVELASRAILYSSRRGENVLDLFGGSGSTLIGCEETQRHGYLMELDEAYSDVIVSRWQKLTGKEAILEATGQTLADVAAEREGEPCSTS